MNFSTWSIKNPIPSVLLFIMLTLVGVMSFQAMKIQQFPDIDLPTVTVTATLPGAAPSQMETEVARKIENSVATLQGVKNIYSKSQDGVSNITVEFRLEKPLQEAADEVRDAVARVRADLPSDLRDPVIQRASLAGAPILTYTLASSRMDAEQLSWFIDDTVTKRMLAVRGVGAVSRVGGVQREVRVELDPARMLALGATAADISRQLRQVQQEASGGRTDVGGLEQSVRTVGTVQSAAQLATMDIVLTDGRRIRLDQVAKVTDTVTEPRSAALLNGKPVVGFEVIRSKGAGEVEVADGVRAALATLTAEHPDLAVTEAFNNVDPVLENFQGSMWLLLEGALLAVIVVWFFLRDWRATFVAAVALPLSIIPTFAAMYLLGFTLNLVTLLALSLVVGILVDDAIVEIENIVRHMRMPAAGPSQGGHTPAGGGLGAAETRGPTVFKTPYQAAMEAADEIGLAVIATTFTLIAVFLPTAFMPGIAGKFFVQFGWTAAIAVFFSLVVARLLTPMMAAYILRPPRQQHVDPAWMTRYLGWARTCLKHRVLTLVVTFSFVVLSFTPMAMGWMQGGFIPPADPAQTQVTLALPPGSTLAQTTALAEDARDIVDRHPQVRSVYTAIGGGATGSDPFAPQGAAEVRRAVLTIKLSPRAERSGISQQAIEQDLSLALQVLPGARLNVGLAGASAKLDLALNADDPRVLVEHAQQVERELRTIAGIGAVTPSTDLARPELVIRPDFARMADLGVTSAAIADTLRVATAGDFDQSLAKLNLAQRQIPIVVMLPAAARQDLDLLRQLTVPGKHGPVPIHQIADLAIDSGPAAIDRLNRARSITLSVELQDQALNSVQAQAFALPSLANPPPGFSARVLGDAEANAELQTGFSLAMLTGVLCIYIVLVLLFKGFAQPLTALGALVLSVPGAFLALFITGTDITMPALIGLIMLMGIATKNSILLIDYVVMARRGVDGGPPLNRWDAVIDACHKRARPIIMTTVAMGAGMLPIAIGFGADPSFRAPMAIVVIGGLITSTFLSLLVIPVLYTLVDDLIGLTGRLFRRRPRATQPQPGAAE
jgi:multidrug efflux pump subunit AcrB